MFLFFLKRKRLILLYIVLVPIIIFHSIRKHPEVRMAHVEGLRANSSWFTLEKKPFRILGGSIHYFRVPRVYWEDRLMKLKACGLNTLTTYVPWNLHEPQRGVFDFENQLDLEAYIRLAGRLGLKVILRPGPYICAEWDLGGLPSAQYSKGGPIIAVQVENEYGSYAEDEAYMPFIKEALMSRGITELLLTSDNKDGLKAGRVEGALETINFQNLDHGYLLYLKAIQPLKPQMVMEYWSGWFDLWGGRHHVYSPEVMMPVVEKLFEMAISINFYMFHGGTNFGFMNGALAVDLPAPKPMITSYDYDAPLSEAGDYTTKYHLLRNFFRQYNIQPLPHLPALQKRIAYQPIVTEQLLPLWEALAFTDKPYRSERPVNMENLPVNSDNGQSYGYTLYETTINSGGVLNSKNNIRDRALVFVDKEYVGFINDQAQKLLLSNVTEERSLSLLVENCGRVNYGKTLNNQRKGIVGDIEFNELPLRDFIIHSLDMNPSFINRLESSESWISMRQQMSFPAFFKGRLYLNRNPKDTFIRLPVWNKGVVFINGQNVGRYWSVGPQETLYIPGSWLKIGENQIVSLSSQPLLNME